MDNYQGSVIALADGSGVVNASDVYQYGPYGEPIVTHPATGVTTPSWSGSRFRYTGQTMLGEARLYYYKARVYAPLPGETAVADARYIYRSC